MTEKNRGGRPRTGHTPRLKIGCARELSDAMLAAAHAQQTTLSAATRAFYAWYTRQPGAKLPARPTAPCAGDGS